MTSDKTENPRVLFKMTVKTTDSDWRLRLEVWVETWATGGGKKPYSDEKKTRLEINKWREERLNQENL